jgi:peroxiredoxin
MAKRVEVSTPAPEIESQDYKGDLFKLSDLQGKKRVLLVFNRGFM